MVIKPVLCMSILRKFFSMLMCSNIFPNLSSIGFRISGLMLRSLIQLELSFCKVIDAFLVWFLYMYLSRLTNIISWKCCLFSSFPFFFFDFFCKKKNQVSVHMKNYMWAFTSILFIPEFDIRLKPYWFCYYSSVLHLETMEGEIFISCFIIWNYFKYSVFLLLFVCFHIKFKLYFNFCKRILSECW